MDAAEAAVRFLAGGTLITAVSLLGETRYRVLSGLLVLFPIVTLVGFYFLGREVPRTALREAVLFSILAVPTVWGFLVAFYLAADRLLLVPALALGIGGWLAVALVVVLVGQRVGIGP